MDWPLLSDSHISALLSPKAYFCLIYLTLLLNPCHHACLFSSLDFTLILPVAVKGNDSRISHGLGSHPTWKTYWVDVSQSPSLTQVSPFHWAQQISYICGAWHCKDFNLETHFPLMRPHSPFKPRSLSIGSHAEKVQIVSVLLLAVPCGIRHLLLNVPSTALEVWTDDQDPWADSHAVRALELVSGVLFLAWKKIVACRHFYSRPLISSAFHSPCK